MQLAAVLTHAGSKVVDAQALIDVDKEALASKRKEAKRLRKLNLNAEDDLVREKMLEEISLMESRLSLQVKKLNAAENIGCSEA